MSASNSSHSPVWMPARIWMPSVSASARRASAQRIAFARPLEGGQVAVAGALDHRAADTFRRFGGDLTKAVQHRATPLVARSPRRVG